VTGEGRTILVWDPLVRVLHWSLATCVIVSFFSHDGPEWLHFATGYAALAIALLRVVLGFVGTPYARFRQFLAGPRATLDYARDVLARREKHYLGHNPLGALMIVALLGSVLAVGVSGILLDTDRFWGDATLEAIHSFVGHLFVPLVILHVGGVIFTSLRQKENLVTAMITGRKTAPHDADAGPV
jgi:cytochrome b